MSHRVLSAIAAASLTMLAISACDSADDAVEMSASAETALERMGLVEGNPAITYGAMSEEDGRFTYTDVVIRKPAGEGGDADRPETVLIERLIVDRPRLEDDQVMMEGIALEGIATEPDEAGSTVRLGRFGIEAPNPALAADIARVLAGDAGDEFKPDWSSYAFGTLSLERFSADSEDENGPTRATLEQFVMQDYSAVDLGRLAVVGLDLASSSDSGPVTVRLGELSVLGLNTAIYTDMMQAMSDGESEAEVLEAYYRSAFTAPTDTFDRFSVRDVAFNAPGLGFTLDELTGTIAESGSRLISELDMASAVLVADAAHPDGAPVAMVLGMLGYEQLDFTLQARSIYDGDTGRAYTDGENYFELRDGVRIEFEQDIAGYDAYLAALPDLADEIGAAEGAEPEMSAVFGAMSPLILNSMSIRIVDLSLLDRALDAGAAAQGMTKEQLRMQTAAMVGMGLMAAPAEIPRPLLSELSTALTTFVNRGGSMTITIDPAEPITFGELEERANAGTLDVETLGLTVTTQAPE